MLAVAYKKGAPGGGRVQLSPTHQQEMSARFVANRLFQLVFGRFPVEPLEKRVGALESLGHDIRATLGLITNQLADQQAQSTDGSSAY